MKRVLAALAVGLVGSIFIWIVVPYNNFVLGNSYISDDYMPVAALFVMAVIVLGLNPLLRHWRPRLALDSLQLSLVFGILLVACVTPSQGLLRELPYGIAGACVRAARDRTVANYYEAVKPPAALFPDPVRYGAETSASTPFIERLAPGERIPWGAWVRPFFAWSGFLVPWWLMMTAMAVIVLPQWRDNERLPFPLLGVQKELVRDPEGNALLPPLLRKRSFWIGAGLAFALHLMAGLHEYLPESVPAIPLQWDLSRCFTEEPLRFLPYYIKVNRLHFIFLGLAFFMPNRIGFSIWFFQIAYAVMVVIWRAYHPPFYYEVITDHRIGAFFAVPLWILWLGRRRWMQVFGALFRPDGDERFRDRAAAAGFVGGCAGMFAWLLWVGVQPVWALSLIVLAVLYALAITRIVAETGLPLIAPDTRYTFTLLRLIPASLRNAATTYFWAVVAFFIGHGNRLCVSTMMVHAMGLDPEQKPKRQTGLAILFLGVIVLSVVICGSAHLWASYHHSMTLDGRESPVSRWGVYMLTWTGEARVREYLSGAGAGSPVNHPAHIAFGAGLAALLYWLCQISPRWPLHPVALLFVANWYAHRVWFNVFLGWSAKMLILRYGGARIYRSARPFFIGLVLGEVSAVAFWGVVTGVLAALGRPYYVVQILPF